MARKFRATEISGNVNIQSNGQHVKANWFCVNCNAVGSRETHYPDCEKKEAYTIPSTAEVPRKKASQKAWDIFKNQFVFAAPIGWWAYFEYSWWAKNMSDK